MTKTIAFDLNKFATIPASLTNGATSVKELSFETKELFHHYFLATYGSANSCGSYDLSQFLTTGTDWRFTGTGIGADKESKRNRSNELAKGFARWFHYTHLGFTYFCPLEQLINKPLADGTKWVAKEAGDIPDYVCGEDGRDVFLLEVKGRYESVGFKTKAFDSFRAQVARVQLRDAAGTSIAVKGFISAARWATESKPNIKAKLLVEDPWTEGRRRGSDERLPAAIGRAMVLGHYAPVLDILRLPLQADALRAGRAVAEQPLTQRTIWRCTNGALADRRFVGGILLDDRTRYSLPPWMVFDVEAMQFVHRRRHQGAPIFLMPSWRFFGVEESVMRTVTSALRQRRQGGEQVPESVTVPEGDLGALSLLRDGTVLGPEDYFAPVGVMEI